MNMLRWYALIGVLMGGRSMVRRIDLKVIIVTLNSGSCH